MMTATRCRRTAICAARPQRSAPAATTCARKGFPASKAISAAACARAGKRWRRRARRSRHRRDRHPARLGLPQKAAPARVIRLGARPVRDRLLLLRPARPRRRPRETRDAGRWPHLLCGRSDLAELLLDLPRRAGERDQGGGGSRWRRVRRSRQVADTRLSSSLRGIAVRKNGVASLAYGDEATPCRNSL